MGVALVTPQERYDILERLVELFKADDQVIGLLLVGSGVNGFQDAYSDIDLIVVLADDRVFVSMYQALKAKIQQAFNVFYHFEQLVSTEDTTLIMMLDNFLELDIQFVKGRVLAMRDKQWLVRYDRYGDLDKRVQESFSETQMLAPRRIYLRVVERIWQPVLKCVAALNRNEIWHALHMLEQIRNETVHLAGINHRVQTSGFTDVDKLPEMFLVHLRHTIPTSTSNVAIRRALRSTVRLFFSEALTLESHLRLDVASKMQEKLMPYIEAYS